MTAAVLSPIVIAHRGASGYLPEHTLPAKAMAHAMGADFIEQDVVLTKDGIPIVLHDIYLESTTDVAQRFPTRARADGRFYAIDFSLAEVRSLRAHERLGSDGKAVYPNRFPADSGDFRVPTLAEEIDLISGLNRSRKRSTGLYVEFKAPLLHRSEGHDIAVAVLQVLHAKGYDQRPEQVFLQCFDDVTLRYLRHDLNTVFPLIQLIADPSWGEDSAVDYTFLQTAAGLDEVARYADGIGPWLQQIYLGRDAQGQAELTELVSLAQARGLQVHPYTFRADDLPAGIDSFTSLLALFFDEIGVDGVFTDFPDLAHDYLQDLRRHRDLP
ncbi:MAG: glycerophosphodiester phosphodiesterase [Haliea sp.]|nr:glycerophosphodiester phosphodiesterase [Haliea sp.]